MNYQSSIKSLALSFTIACLLLLNSSQASTESPSIQLKPYTAVYDLYVKGFYAGESTQTLQQFGDLWLIRLTTKAKGFARFLQKKPAIEEQVFKIINNEIHLISNKTDTGTKKKKAKNSAYFIASENQFKIQTYQGPDTLKATQPIYSFLILPIKAQLLSNHQTQAVTLYDKGKLLKQTVKHKGKQLSEDVNEESIEVDVIEVSSKNSSKKMQYLYAESNTQIPTRIEKFKNDKSKMYMQLKSFKNL